MASRIRARRLDLTYAELALLAHLASVALPIPLDDSPRPDLEAAEQLHRRGVLASATEVKPSGLHPSVALNLGVLVAPAVALRLDLVVRTGVRRAAFGVAGPFGASLIARPRYGAQLSLFPATRLSAELARAVPPALPEAPADVVRRALGGPAAVPRRCGRLDALPAQVARTSRAVLHATVGARAGDRTLSGHVVWLATDDGWVGLRARDELSVEAVPVRPADIGVWLAPLVGTALSAESRGG